MQTLYDFSLTGIDGRPIPAERLRNKVVLLVNVASECGLTPQYDGLETLYRKFGDHGLTVVGLPCNQFGAQEPGSEAEIQHFCNTRYNVTFPLTCKIEVNGEGQDPLYAWLKGETGGEDISWNFEKFLIDRKGRVKARFAPRTEPQDQALGAAIQEVLTQSTDKD